MRSWTWCWMMCQKFFVVCIALEICWIDMGSMLSDMSTDDEGNESSRTLGLVVARGTLLVLVSPVDGSEEIANPFVSQEDEWEKIWRWRLGRIDRLRLLRQRVRPNLFARPWLNWQNGISLPSRCWVASYNYSWIVSEAKGCMESNITVTICARAFVIWIVRSWFIYSTDTKQFPDPPSLPSYSTYILLLLCWAH